MFPLGIPTLVGNLIVRLNFLSPPLFFGIFIVCAGGGRLLLDDIRFQSHTSS